MLARAVLVGIVAIHVVFLVWTPYLNHDAAAYVSAAQLLLRGGRPGIEIVDTNPPMIIYLTALPVIVAGWLHVSASASVLLFFFGAIAVGGVLFVRALRVARPIEPGTADLVLALWFLLSLRIYWSMGMLRVGGDFGQRDQLIFAWLAPFVVLRAARYLDRRVPVGLASVIAILAAVAIAMKPFFVVPVCGCELLFALSFKRVRTVLAAPDWWVVVIGQAVFLLHFVVVPGGSAFLTRWLPQIVRGYSAYGSPIGVVLQGATHGPRAYVWAIALVVLCSHPLWRRSRESVLPGGFGWFAALSLLLYMVEAKGWSYQLWPYYGALLMGSALLVVETLGDRTAGAARGACVVCVCGALVVLTLPAPPRPSLLARRLAAPPFSFPMNGVAAVIEALSAPDDRILMLSTSVLDSYPALTYTGRLPASRFVSAAFPLAFFFSGSRDYEVPAAWRQEEAQFYAALVDDARAWSPRLAFVHDGPGQALPAGFRVTRYLERRGFFESALSAYVPVGRVADFLVYLRGDGPARSECAACDGLAPATRAVIDQLRHRGVLAALSPLPAAAGRVPNGPG